MLLVAGRFHMYAGGTYRESNDNPIFRRFFMFRKEEYHYVC